MNTLIPNARNLSRHLRIFAEACSATEVILFERATFLVIATSSSSDASDSTASHSLDPKRYERTSELIKAFKQTCSRLREEFHSLEMELAEFTAVLDEMTKNTYVLVVVHNPVVGKRSLSESFCLLSFLFRNRSNQDEHSDGKEKVRRASRRYIDIVGRTTLCRHRYRAPYLTMKVLFVNPSMPQQRRVCRFGRKPRTRSINR